MFRHARLCLRLLILACLCAPACSNLPRDPESTLQHVEGGRLRVGLVEHPPWVIRTRGEEPAGAEVQMVRQLAQELGATPEWHWGSEQQHMEALEYFQLDLVIGGLNGSTPWSKKVGLTAPYFEERFIVAVTPAGPPPKSLKGVSVAVKAGEATVGYLESEGARPLLVSDLEQASGSTTAAAAGPAWRLEQLGLVATDFKLYSEQHVMATPPGENGWIKRLDEFLYRERAQVAGLLKQEEAKQ